MPQDYYTTIAAAYRRAAEAARTAANYAEAAIDYPKRRSTMTADFYIAEAARHAADAAALVRPLELR